MFFIQRAGITYLASLLAICGFTQTGSPVTASSSKNITVQFVPDTTDFPNPERGFYRYSATTATAYVPLQLDELKKFREGGTVAGAYNVVSTLVFRYFVLDGFTQRPLSVLLLDKIQKDLDAVRQAGMKMIARFCYTIKATAGSCPEGFICPPYGDAPKAMVLTHVAQLKPILVKNADVIACLQLGFIGTWGENYYTDHFGDASANKKQGKLLDKNWKDRIDVLKALLDALPKDRMVQIRYPQFKQRFAYGLQANVNGAPLTATEAFNGSDKARIAFHNDCFLSGADDTGTFDDYGNSSTNRNADSATVAALRCYKERDSRFVAVGGETCMDTYKPQNNCETAGRAQTEMSQFHYSFLNADYNKNVNAHWQTGGCMRDIKIKLGYRFVLRDVKCPRQAKAGSSIVIQINLENVGYASPFNPRLVQLLLRHKLTGRTQRFTLNTEVRRWFSGSVGLRQRIGLPTNLPAGEYEVLLFLPDKYKSISTRPDYAIRFVNRDVWEEKTGYNKLSVVLTVSR